MIQPTEPVLDYIEKLYTHSLLSQTTYTTLTRPEQEGELIDEDVARFFRLLLLIKRPQAILEIGTSVGYSTVTMAQIVQLYGGHITTIELEEKTAITAKENFSRYGVDQTIEVVIGDATTIVPTIEKTFDYIFMDVGDKALYRQLLNDCVDKLNLDGILVAEDSLYGAYRNDLSAQEDEEFEEMIRTLDDFNRAVASHPALESTVLPLGDGVTLAVKK